MQSPPSHYTLPILTQERLERGSFTKDLVTKQREGHFNRTITNHFAVAGEFERPGKIAGGVSERDADGANRFGGSSAVRSGDPADSEAEIGAAFEPGGFGHSADDMFADG